MKSSGVALLSIDTLGSSRMRMREFGKFVTCERARKFKLYSLWSLLTKTWERSSGEICLLNVVGKHLAISQIGGYVYVRRGNEAIGKIVNSFHIKTRATLIRMIRISLVPQHAILHYIKAGIEKRTRVRARAQVGAKTHAA